MVYAQFKKGPKVSKSQTLHDASNVWIYNDLYIWAGWWFETYLIFSIQLGTSSSHLTNSYFSEGLKPPTRNIPYNYIPLRTIKSPSSTALQSHSKAQKTLSKTMWHISLISGVHPRCRWLWFINHAGKPWPLGGPTCHEVRSLRSYPLVSSGYLTYSGW